MSTGQRSATIACKSHLRRYMAVSVATGMLYRFRAALASYPCRLVVLDVEHLPAVLCGGAERLDRCKSNVTVERASAPTGTEYQATSARYEDGSLMLRVCGCVNWQLEIHICTFTNIDLEPVEYLKC